MSFNPHHEMLVVDKSMLGSGSGTAGLLKISLRETSSQEYIPVHCKPVRDVQCCPRGSGLILTTSLDRTLKLTSTVGSNSIVQRYDQLFTTPAQLSLSSVVVSFLIFCISSAFCEHNSFELESPGWSCNWKDDDTNYMFCGLANGTVLMFDIRSTKGPVARLQHGSRKPIHSMTYIARSNEARVSGLVVGSFDYVFLWNAAENGGIGLHENNEMTQHSKFDVQVSGQSGSSWVNGCEPIDNLVDNSPSSLHFRRILLFGVLWPNDAAGIDFLPRCLLHTTCCRGTEYDRRWITHTAQDEDP